MAKSYEASGKTVDEAIDLACALAGTTIENVEIEILELGGKGLFGFGQKDARVRITVEEKENQKKAPATTFGQKRNIKELRVKKNPPPQIEIKPIIVVDPKKGAAAVGQEAFCQQRKDAEKSRNPSAHIYTGEKAETENRRESHATMIKDGEMAQGIFEVVRAFTEPIFSQMGVMPEYHTQIKEGILWIILKGEKLGLLIGRRGETLNAIQYLVNLAVNRHRNDHVRVVLDVEGYRESREQTLSALAHRMADKAVKSGRRVELEPMNPHERRIVHIALQNDKRVETTSHGEEPYRRVVVTSRHHGGKRNNHGHSAPPAHRIGEPLPHVIIEHDINE